MGRFPASTASLDDLLDVAGAIAETMDRRYTLNLGVSLTSGTLRVNAVALQAGRVINAISFLAGGAGVVGPLNQWACLVRVADLSVLGKTLDDTVNGWNGNVIKTFPFAAGIVVPETGLYYAGLVVNATTPPGSAGSGTANLGIGQPPLLAGNSTTLLTDPASLGPVIAGVGANSLVYAKLT